MIFIALLIGCVLLYKGGDWLLDGMIGIGESYGLPKAMIGLVLVSVGTSAPELFVSLGSALQDHGGMAAGNVVGSNIINIAIVLGLIVCLSALAIGRVLQVQVIAVTLISIVAIVVMSDGSISRFEGAALMLLMLLSFLFAFSHSARTVESDSDEGNADIDLNENNGRKLIVFVIGGLLALLVGAESMIWGGLQLAERLGWSETVVALTVTAFGTSLPEIAASVVAITRREFSLALGNVIGSNMLNVGLVLGLSALIIPLDNIGVDAYTSAYFTGLIVLILMLSFKPGYLPRIFGYCLLVSYAVYVGMLLR